MSPGRIVVVKPLSQPSNESLQNIRNFEIAVRSLRAEGSLRNDMEFQIYRTSTRCRRKVTHGASSLRAKRSNPGPTHALSGSLRRFAPRDDAVSPSFDSEYQGRAAQCTRQARLSCCLFRFFSGRAVFALGPA